MERANKPLHKKRAAKNPLWQSGYFEKNAVSRIREEKVDYSEGP